MTTIELDPLMARIHRENPKPTPNPSPSPNPNPSPSPNPNPKCEQACAALQSLLSGDRKEDCAIVRKNGAPQ